MNSLEHVENPKTATEMVVAFMILLIDIVEAKIAYFAISDGHLPPSSYRTNTLHPVVVAHHAADTHQEALDGLYELIHKTKKLDEITSNIQMMRASLLPSSPIQECTPTARLVLISDPNDEDEMLFKLHVSTSLSDEPHLADGGQTAIRWFGPYIIEDGTAEEHRRFEAMQASLAEVIETCNGAWAAMSIFRDIDNKEGKDKMVADVMRLAGTLFAGEPMSAADESIFTEISKKLWDVQSTHDAQLKKYNDEYNVLKTKYEDLARRYDLLANNPFVTTRAPTVKTVRQARKRRFADETEEN
jgi:hypothetical protein